jgi:aspartyl/asparaginyl-tRNA synthetase
MAETSPLPNLCINPAEFNEVVQKLRFYFLSKGFLEVHTQNRLSILAACEDPSTISTYDYAGKHWPLPQTGQMWLEYEMLKNPQYPGLFCVSTSYRNEPNPVPGRHDLIFPMFEFEIKGGLDDLLEMEKGLLESLGYGKRQNFHEGNYVDIAKEYHTHELQHNHENMLYSDYGSVFFLKNFPDYTSPFWNMARNQDCTTSKKIDVILSGQETIGSAERSCDPKVMREEFKTISNGMYAKTIYNHFGKERVDRELEEFLAMPFFPRSGGGIGITRLIRSMKMENLLAGDANYPKETCEKSAEL